MPPPIEKKTVQEERKVLATQGVRVKSGTDLKVVVPKKKKTKRPFLFSS